MTTTAIFMLLILVACNPDVLEVEDIASDLPEIVNISATSSLVVISNEVEVSVEAVNGNTYEWSAPAGSFSSATTSTTTWTAPEEANAYTLTCTVSNGNGSRKASISVIVAATLLPDGVSGYWGFENGFDEAVASATANSGVTNVSIVSDTKYGNGAAEFTGPEDEVSSALLYPDADLAMGPDDEFTISVWVKTTDDNFGFVFGKSSEGTFLDNAKGMFLENGAVVFDIFGIGAFWTDAVVVNDNEWHHIAMVKADGEFSTYVDGENVLTEAIEEWSDDEDTIITIGAAAEEPGADWPGIYQGLIDDVRFYQEALDAAAIADIFNE